ncbi:MAG: bifunctional phosphoribosylaminoimidazolecarboxamide formyltransferase/IMP cyclohydrolase [Candidatus Krumholzibacteriota bacterium]|nr:bifunctional phosphoribosylaminoimidazolecarboxamide formyltransferase/IMP cyclohydrolase [Candidatus Krumholzibacteriota bacterium]
MNRRIERALMSVTDKTGVVEFARELASRGVEIVASGGTARAIAGAGIAVTEISDLTGFPECMDGRVKTLHPKVHGGILADRDREAHLEQAAELGIALIDLVAVNLYRFREASSDPTLSEREIVEQIDIGGPTLIRSAAKNFHSVAVVVDPGDYGAVIAEMDGNGDSLTLETRRRFSSKAFHHTASYDAAISRWYDEREEDGDLPGQLVTVYTKIRPLRYGENPHQAAALYRQDPPVGRFHEFVQYQGKELSYNNIQDTWAAFRLARDLGPGGCAVMKHANPCGAAVCATPWESFVRARKTDPVSAFGSIVAVNGEIDGRLADASKEGFVEVLIARGYTDEARESLRKKKNLRLLALCDEEWERDLAGLVTSEAGPLLLVQERDEGFPELDDWRLATSRAPSPDETKAMRLAWVVAKHVKSNAIVICDREGTVGVGAGQMSRVDSCMIAVDKARREGLEIEGCSAGSDAFFPFPDGPETLARAGVRCIVQPGGSMRDEEVVAAAEKLGLTMVMTGRRHFRH